MQRMMKTQKCCDACLDDWQRKSEAVFHSARNDNDCHCDEGLLLCSRCFKAVCFVNLITINDDSND